MMVSADRKKEEMFSFAMKDDFFAGILHDLIDFGYEINFSVFGGAGVYVPKALRTEQIDSPLKQQQFASGFWAKVEAGELRAKMRFSSLLSIDTNTHYFLHELMHFYQDMHGLYLTPLQEQGTAPICLDAKSYIVAIVFCEAWAETEAIRASWALREKGDERGWSGVTKSPDWRELALAYDKDMQDGVDETKAAANTFQRWYEGKHREFYEKNGLSLYRELVLPDMPDRKRNMDAYNNYQDSLKDNLRQLELPMLIARIPKNDIPKFFHQIDWMDSLYSGVKTGWILHYIDRYYDMGTDSNIQQVKCGAPPYLWNRLRKAAQEASEIPAH